MKAWTSLTDTSAVKTYREVPALRNNAFREFVVAACRFSFLMSRRVALNCADGGVLTLCPPRRFSISCPLLEWCVSRMQATGRLSAVRPRDTGRHRMPQTRKGVSGGSCRDPQFGTWVRTERDDHRAATRLERGVGVADETVVPVNRRYRGDVTAS